MGVAQTLVPHARLAKPLPVDGEERENDESVAPKKRKGKQLEAVAYGNRHGIVAVLAA